MKKFFGLFKFRGPISIIFYIALAALLWALIIPRTSVYFRTQLYNPFLGTLNYDDITLVKGESIRLHVTNVNKRVTYKTTDMKVAGVSLWGKVTAYRVGTTFIIVKTGDKEFKCRVRVIDLNKDTLVLKVGESSRLDLKGVWFYIGWKSSNNSVTTVSRFGKVKGVSKGSAKIYAKVRGKTLTCLVVVH